MYYHRIIQGEPKYAPILRHLEAGAPGFSQKDRDKLARTNLNDWLETYLLMLDGKGRER